VLEAPGTLIVGCSLVRKSRQCRWLHHCQIGERSSSLIS